MCQCPQRAIFISTVPSGNPHKHWLSSLIFAGICLNILNSTVFPSFSGLFIICSYLAILFFPRPLQILYFIICFSKSLFSNFLNFNRNCLSVRLTGEKSCPHEFLSGQIHGPNCYFYHLFHQDGSYTITYNHTLVFYSTQESSTVLIIAFFIDRI